MIKARPFKPGEGGGGALPAAARSLVHPSRETVKLDSFFIWLFQQAGLDAQVYQAAALQRRLPACLRALRVSSSEAARALLKQRPELISKAINAVLIGVSQFFRDSHVFHYLRDIILPGLVKTPGGLRIYSAGCSSGQELYSMAMLLRELNGLEESYLLGVDCRPEAIRQAEAGAFHEKELTGLLFDQFHSHFERQGLSVKISPALQSRAHWRVGNILTPPDSSPWDIILCRNVAIYLDYAQTAALWSGLHSHLKKGGILVVGKAERPPGSLGLIRLAPCIFRRTDE